MPIGSRSVAIFAAAAAMIFSVGTASATTLRVAHASPEKSLINEAMIKFKEAVETKTDGSVTIEIFPNAVLGDEGPISEAVGEGSIDIGLGGVVDAIDPRLNVVALPFLYKDFNQVHTLLDGPFGDKLKAMAAPRGYRILGILDSGFRNFTNNERPIVKPEDFEGLKLRVPPIPVALETIKAFGALPQTVPYGETYIALQSGAVDGAEPEIRDFYDAKWYEVQKYLSVSNYMWMANYWYMNADRLASLSEDEQKAVVDSAKEVEAWYRSQLDAVYKDVFAKVKEAGVEINEVDTAPFIGMAEPVYETFAKEYGADLVAEIRQAVTAQ